MNRLVSHGAGGTISHCPHQGCGHTCCEFAEGNYIVLYPGERERAERHGESLDHLSLRSVAAGGYRAVCRAADKSSCDGGYKPLDCASYPYFPIVDDTGQVEAGLKGDKCPLVEWQLVDHRRWVVRQWQRLVDVYPSLANWLRSTHLVGYSRAIRQ